MFADLVSQAGTYIETNPWLAVLAIFVGGLLTAACRWARALTPPLWGSAGGLTRGVGGGGRSLLLSVVFVVGLSLTFTGLGMFAALAGQLYGDISSVWNWVVVVVCLAMGLHLMEVVQVPIPAVVRFRPRARGVLGALVLGLLFGFVSAPCAAPILVVLLTYLAGANASVPYGGLLLLVYGLGHSVLILVAGTSVGAAQRLIDSRSLNRATGILRRVAGAVIVLVGLYFAWAGLA